MPDPLVETWNGRRLKSVVMVAALVVSGLIIVAWTQPWFTVTLADDELGGASIEVAGDVAAGGLAGLGLAGLALVGALSIAGHVFRIVLGVLQALIGATVALSAAVAIAGPVEASSAAVTESTGIAGLDSVGELVRSVALGFWPYAAVVLGVSAVVLGAVIALTSRRWPGAASRKYSVPRSDAADDPLHAVATPADEHGAARSDATAPADPPTDTIADWDALSDGSDPTSR